jgi:thioredoxin-related protein
MNLKPMITAATAMLAIHCSAVATADEPWTNDFASAKKLAVETKKSLLVDFTGSDWCGFCIALDKEVFAKDEFKKLVAEKFVPVTIDFPQDKAKMSEETTKQNDELQEKYGVEGYPTVLLTDETGKPFASTGYRKGGAEPYVKHLNELLASRDKRDKAFKQAADATGVDKAKALLEGLNAMELSESLRAKFYGKEIEEIKKADPDDATGFGKVQKAKERFAKFETELGELGEKSDIDGALKLVEKELKDGAYAVEENQQLMLIRGMIFAEQKKFDEALKAIDEAKKLAPDSDLAENAEVLKKQIEQAKKGDAAEE